MNFKLDEKEILVCENTDGTTLAAAESIGYGFTCEVRRTHSLELTFRIPEGVEEEMLVAELLDANGNSIQAWNFSAGELEEGAYTASLADALTVGESYTLRIAAASTGENISFGRCNLQYDTLSAFVVLLAGILMMGCLFTCLIVWRGYPVNWRMLTIFLVGMAYFLVTPVYTAPDETGHYRRIYEISEGRLFCDVAEDGQGISIVPDHLIAESLSYFRSSAVYEREKQALRETVYDLATLVEALNTNQALYAPTTYIPQAIGVFLARMVSNHSLVIFYAARLASFFFGLLAAYGAMRLMPDYRDMIFCIVMTPMYLQEMISCAADATVNSVTLFYVAFLFYLKGREQEVRRLQLLAVFALSVFLALCKVVYIPFVLLVFLIPNTQFHSRGKGILFKVATLGISVIAFGAWTGYAMRYLQTGGVKGAEIQSSEQIAYVLTHITDFIEICANTTWSYIYTWMQCGVGSALGPLAVGVDGFFITILLFFILFHVFFEVGSGERKQNLTTGERVLVAAVILGTIALTYASLYVQWTPYQDDLIEGIQGRYFIPLVFPLAVAVKRHSVMVSEEKLHLLETQVMYVVHIAVLCTLYRYYV